MRGKQTPRAKNGKVSAFPASKARKRAEEVLREQSERFRFIMDHANDAIIYLDLNGSILWANRPSTVLTGRTMTELVGNSVMPILTPETASAAEARLAAVRRGEAVPPLVEFEFLRPDGTLAVVEANSTSVWGAEGVVGRLLVLRDITERKRAEEERENLYERLHASHAGLRTLSRRLMEVQEQERRHLASELHDEIGQALTAVKINLQQAVHIPVSPEAGTHLEESVNILDRTLQQVRNLSLDLRPSLLDDLGLAPTLKWMADRHAQASGITITFSSDMKNIRFPVEVELACYRTAQEALTNAIRHANATMIAIAMVCSDSELRLTVRDDGVGFDLTGTLTRAREGKSAGLLGIMERVSLLGGQLDIQSRQGNGTQFYVRFPLSATHIPDASHP